MNSLGRTVVAVSLAIAVLASVLFVGPVAGLGWDRGETGADPDTAGSVATYRMVLIADDGDTIVANGLRRVVLLFGADPDFLGSVADVTASDVRVSLDDGTRTAVVDGLRVAPNAAGDRLRITLSTPGSGTTAPVPTAARSVWGARAI